MRTPLSPSDPGAVPPTLRVQVSPPTGSVTEPKPREALAPSTERFDASTPPPRVRPGFPTIRGYDLIRIVGTGGMGIVYEAQHRELNRRVAIKMLRGESLTDPGFRERFRAEAGAIARLQHPNVIQVFEVGTVDPRPEDVFPSPFIALEYVDGGSLAQRTHAPQPPQEAARIVETLARAANAAHRLGVVHRDLKPANVLLTRDGEPKIADFGIAKQLDADHAGDRGATRNGVVMGTPEYMAPEQFEGEPVTPAVDVYSLGVILYQLLTGRVPLQGATFPDTMLLVLHEEPVAPRRFQPAVPRDLETICLKCLAKDPRKRYASAAALADDLERWVAGRPIRARAVGPVGRASRWAGRNPAVAMLSAAVLAVAVAGLAGVLWKWRESEANADSAHANAARAAAEADNAREAARNERWENYRTNLKAASSALRLYDANAARRALDDAPEEYRDWTWLQLRAQLDRAEAVVPASDEIAAGLFTPDGRWLLTRGSRRFHLWDVAARTTGVHLDLGEDPRDPIFSRDGATLAYGFADGTVRLRDRATGTVRLVLRGHTTGVTALRFANGDKQVVALAADDTVRAWDARTGEPVFRFVPPTKIQNACHLSLDGRFLATRAGNGDPTRIWELATGREVMLADAGQRALFVTFDSACDRVVTIPVFPDNAIRVWDLATGKLLATMHGHTNQVLAVSFSTDGKRLVSSSLDRTVRVWDVSPEPAGRQTEPLLVLRGHTGGVEHAAFSPDGTRVVSASQDRTIRYWDARTGELITVLCGHALDVHTTAFLSGGETLVSASADGTVRYWNLADIERGYAVRGHNQFVYSVAFFPDGKRVASAAWDGTARVWDATSGRPLRTLDHGEYLYVVSVAVHPNGRTMATLSRHPRTSAAIVRLWDEETGRILREWQVASGWQDGRLAFNPSGTVLAVGCPDNHVRLWNLDTWKETVLEGHTAPVRDVLFSPCGRWLASVGDDGDKTVRIWDAQTWSPLAVLHGHTRGAYSLAWNRDSTRLASGSLDGTARLWDTATWREQAVLRNGASVYGVTFTADGKLLAAACRDNLIRIWDVRFQREVAELSGHDNYVHQLALSPDGTRLVSGSGDRTLRVWDTLAPAERAKR